MLPPEGQQQWLADLSTQLELVGKMPLLRETTITMSSSPLYTSHTTLVALASRPDATRREVVCGKAVARRPSRDDLGASSSLNAFFPSVVIWFNQLQCVFLAQSLIALVVC